MTKYILTLKNKIYIILTTIKYIKYKFKSVLNKNKKIIT